jgi:Xaa-Pro aminopeptidase
MFKPGVTLAEIYNKVVSVVESSNILKKYPRGHVGHSIGINPGLEEYPQISPDSTTVLQPGMVFSFETPYYGNRNASITTGPINIEDSLAITETGMERFTHVNDNLRWN